MSDNNRCAGGSSIVQTGSALPLVGVLNAEPLSRFVGHFFFF